MSAFKASEYVATRRNFGDFLVEASGKTSMERELKYTLQLGKDVCSLRL